MQVNEKFSCAAMDGDSRPNYIRTIYQIPNVQF